MINRERKHQPAEDKQHENLFLSSNKINEKFFRAFGTYQNPSEKLSVFVVVVVVGGGGGGVQEQFF